MSLSAPQQAYAASITQKRLFQGSIRRSSAEQAAQYAAKLSLLDSLAQELATTPDLRFMTTAQGGTPLSHVELLGLTAQLYTLHVTAQGFSGFPPHIEAVTEMTAQPVANFRATLIRCITQLERCQLYGMALERQRSILKAYDTLAAQLFALPSTTTATQDVLAAQFCLRALQGSDQYIQLLHSFSDTWEQAEQVLPLLKKAQQLDPENPLILASMAEVLLQLDRASEALLCITDAEKLLPSYAKIHGITGAIYLRQRLPSLAAQSFGKAIQYAPQQAAYYSQRAAAYLILEEQEKMCADFYAACTYGECDGLSWARTTGQCVSP